tara:strand:+ start:459 stop:764 length:306 start_codon:yes stop_codon:yes gene_type:complete
MQNRAQLIQSRFDHSHNDAEWPTQQDDITWLLEHHNQTYQKWKAYHQSKAQVDDLATCVFQTSDGRIELKLPLKDVPQLVNTLVAKTCWTLTQIQISMEDA